MYTCTYQFLPLFLFPVFSVCIWCPSQYWTWFCLPYRWCTWRTLMGWEVVTRSPRLLSVPTPPRPHAHLLLRHIHVHHLEEWDKMLMCSHWGVHSACMHRISGNFSCCKLVCESVANLRLWNTYKAAWLGTTVLSLPSDPMHCHTAQTRHVPRANNWGQVMRCYTSTKGTTTDRKM